VISREAVVGVYPVKPLGEVVEFLDSQRKPVKESERRAGSYPYYGANGQQGTIDGYLFDESLVLLAEDGGFFDQPDRGIAYRISGKTWVNNHAHVLRPKPILDLGYLCRVLENYDVTPYVTGTTRGKLTKSGASEIPLPLPPIAQQKRIAAILDRAEELRSLRRQALGALDAIAQSIFLEMFGDPVTNPKSWVRVHFSDLLSAIESGRSPNCLDRPVEDEEWGVLKLGAVTWCEYNPLENKALPSNEKPNLSLEVKPGDLLFTRKNTFELVAACALVRSTPPRLLLPDLIFRFRSKPNAPIGLCFLHQLLINPAKRREIQKLASGSASSMPNISKTKLETVLIELPPLPLQQEFARRVEAIEQLKTTHRESLAQLDALFASLQHRAFRGELSP